MISCKVASAMRLRMHRAERTTTMRAIMAALLTVSVGGCETPNGGVETLPTGPTPPAATPAPPRASGPFLSGTVFESTPEGRRPLLGSSVWLVEGDTVTSVVTDGDGRYSIATVPTSRRRRILAFPPLGRELFQRSATAAPVNGDAAVDIELVSEGIRGSTYGSPTLSGVVYYMNAQGPHPWPHTPVVFKAFDGPWYDVYQVSDAEGRYDFGRLPLGAGQLGAGNCNDQMQFEAVDVRGDTVANIDITALLTTCPGIAF